MAKHRRKSKRDTKSRQRLKTVAKWGALLAITYEAYMILVDRRQRSRDVFTAALNAKRATGKPLLVLGDPDDLFVNRVMGRDWDCEDLCIDPKGCEKCPTSKGGDPLVSLEALGTGSHVVFVAPGQFERAHMPHALADQLKRVSGGDLYVAPRQKWSLSSFSPFMRQRVVAAPPKDPTLDWKKLPWGKEQSGTLALRGLRGSRMDRRVFGYGG
jgi:hypothetical protein